MNSIFKAWTSKILLLIAIILILGIPFATRYFPNPDIEVALWDLSKTAKFANYRMSVLVFGFTATAFSFLLFFMSAFNENLSRSHKALNFSLFILVYSLGAIDYIYWALGHFSLRVEGFYDNPQSLKIATYFIAQLWETLIFIHLLILFIVVPILTLLCLIKLFSNKENKFEKGAIIVFNILSVIATYKFYDYYWFWLND